MAPVRKPAAPTLPPTTAPKEAGRAAKLRAPPTPIEALPAKLREHAKFADSHFGNKDGTLDPGELAKYAAAYGTQPGFKGGVIGPLEEALGEKIELEPVTTPGPAANKSLASKLTVSGGSADQSDVELVAAQLAKLPASVLERMEAKGLKVIAARGSVTDVCTELKGVQPRGWPPGATWDNVPGLYDPSRKAVIIATVENGAGNRVVPPRGNLHGSFDLVLHETAHGLDYRKVLDPKGSATAEFVKAYEADRAKLQSNQETYLLQAGNAGREEAYAETCGRFFAGDPKLPKDYPNLYGYWRVVEKSVGVS